MAASSSVLFAFLAYPYFTAAFLINTPWIESSFIKVSESASIKLPIRPTVLNLVSSLSAGHGKRMNLHVSKFRSDYSICTKASDSSRGVIEDVSTETFEPVVIKVKDKPVLRIVPNTQNNQRA